MLKECCMISAFRKNKNLKDILVHTAFNNENERKKEMLRVANIGFIRLPYVLNKDSRVGVNLWQALKPTTKNAIYAIRCKACHKLYIGETRNAIILRIKQHMYKMNSGNGTSILYMHFNLHVPHNLQSLGL